ncbi:MAG: hypothetical protein IPK72_21245 [Candidatus Eisenbacteria bacterium]|nr:hypothetical protein [Candidatus Eisenbacteria bacterium]
MGKTTLAVEEVLGALVERRGRCVRGIAFLGEPTIEITVEKVREGARDRAAEGPGN